MRSLRTALFGALLTVVASTAVGVLGAYPATASGTCPPGSPCGGTMPTDPASPPAKPTTKPPVVTPPNHNPPPATHPATHQDTVPAAIPQGRIVPRHAAPPVHLPAPTATTPETVPAPSASSPASPSAEPVRTDAVPVHANACPAVTAPKSRSPWFWLLLGLVIGTALGVTVMAFRRRKAAIEPTDEPTDEAGTEPTDGTVKVDPVVEEDGTTGPTVH
jgi:hypothetical protein